MRHWELDRLVRKLYDITCKLHLGRLMERSLTAQEAADCLGYNVKHLYRLLDSGRMKAQRVGHIWLTDRKELERIKTLQGSGGRLPKTVPEH